MFTEYSALAVLLGILVIVAAEVVMIILEKKGLGFGLRIFIALIAGLVFGVLYQLVFPLDGKAQNPNFSGVVASEDALPKLLGNIYSWTRIVTEAYTNLLLLMVVPLVAVSIIGGLMKAGAGGKGIGKSAGITIATLMITCGIAALISVAFTTIAGLKASALLTSGEALVPSGQAGSSSSTLQSTIATIFSARNIFGAFSANSILPVIFLSLILGVIFNNITKESPDIGAKIAGVMDVLSEIVFGLVDIVIGLAPYAVFLFMLNFGAQSAASSYLTLAGFVGISYVCIIVMFLLHLLLVFLCGVSLKSFFKNGMKAISMGFVTRSSAATLPVTIESMVNMGVEETTANFAGTFGTCVGQNGCAGMYPAILGTMVFNDYYAQNGGGTIFSEPMTLIMFIFFIIIASLGIAGVGGGATAAGYMVFGMMSGMAGGWLNDSAIGLALIPLLFAVEPLIDMGRTALNVTDSLSAGVFAARMSGNLNTRQLAVADGVAVDAQPAQTETVEQNNVEQNQNND